MSVILLTPAKSRSRSLWKPFPWKRAARLWPFALTLALGWAGGFFHGSYRGAERTISVEAVPAHSEGEVAAAAPVPSPAARPPAPILPGVTPSIPEPVPVSSKIAVTTTVPPRPPAVALAKPAPSPEPAKLPSHIRITSRPEKAEVYAAEKFLGLTPLNLNDIPAGNYTFRVEKERHTRKLVETRVKAGATVELDVELQYDPEPRTGKPFTSGHGIRMQWIPWLQGWAAAVELPQSAYEAVTHENPSEHKEPGLPVTNVTWAKAMTFCDLLTIAERGLGFLPEGYAYALPSDEEWSRLAKDTPLTQAVTSLRAPREGPAPVGSLPANALGLHDLRGNVWEWCRDSYTAEVHRRQLVENATGDSSRINQRYKILRGGSWNRTSENNLGLGFRLAADGNSHSDYETGFRVILVKADQP